MDPLATAGELGIHLQRTDLDPDRAEQAVQLASGAVRAYCRWNISEVTETLEVEGSGGPVLSLPTPCLVDVTEIRINGTAIDLTDPLLAWTKKGQIFRAAGWPSLCRVEADVTHGFAEIPDVVKLVVLELAARTFQQHPSGLRRVQVGTVSRTYATDASTPKLSELDQRLLERYSL